jgi:hypothetical protein
MLYFSHNLPAVHASHGVRHGGKTRSPAGHGQKIHLLPRAIAERYCFTQGKHAGCRKQSFS